MAPTSKVAHDEGAGVDERVAGDPALVLRLDEGVEGVTRWLPAHPPEDVLADVLESGGQREDLDDALDGEAGIGVAGDVLGAVHLAQREREAFGPLARLGDLVVLGQRARLGGHLSRGSR
nr:hypothetical protein [Blastococcus aurantiacus]